MHMFMRPATQNVLCCLVKGNTFVFMGFTNFLFSTVCVRATFPYGITFMMHDKAYNSPSPLLRVTQAVQKSWLWQRESLHIFLSVRLPLCIPLHASMKSVFIPPCGSISTRCKPSSSLGGGFGMSVHSWTFLTNHACVHTFAPTRWTYLLFYCQYQAAQGLWGLTAVDRTWIVEVKMMAALAVIE